MKVILSSKFEICWIILLLVACIFGAFYFGTWVNQQTTSIISQQISQQIYQRGFTAGEASGQNKMQTQCDREVQALARNCNVWENTNLRFGNVNLTQK